MTKCACSGYDFRTCDRMGKTWTRYALPTPRLFTKEHCSVFSLFKSRRSQWKERAQKAFDNYIPSLQGMDAEEIGAVLDLAAEIRDASLLAADMGSPYHLAFSDPLMLPEGQAFEYLAHWQKTMLAGPERWKAWPKWGLFPFGGCPWPQDL